MVSSKQGQQSQATSQSWKLYRSSDSEIWKPIPILGLEKFEVSNLGRVRSQRAIRKLTKAANYWQISFWINKKQKIFKVSRLVLMAFVSPPPSHGHMAMHLDDNTDNNRLDNLKWGTRSENVKMAYAHGLIKSPMKGKFGSKHHNAKKVSQQTLDGLQIAIYGSGYEAARAVGTSQGNIARCLTGMRKTCKGFIWKYAA